MARRILYNPADFVEASTPFYDNVVGAINDQADRITRNLLLQREEQMAEDKMRFDVGMQERRMQMQKQLQDESIQARRDESALDREHQGGQFNTRMGLEWAKLGLSQRKEAIDAAMKRQQGLTEDYKKQINEVQETLVKSGFLDISDDIGLQVGDFGDGQFRVFSISDMTQKDLNPEELPTAEEWLSSKRILHNISQGLLQGKDWKQWTRENLYDAKNTMVTDSEGNEISKSGFSGTDSMSEDVVVTGDGRTLYGKDAFANMLIQVQERMPGWETAAETINNILDADSQVGLLYKEDDVAENFDMMEISSTMNRVRSILQDATPYSSRLFNEDGTTNVEDVGAYIPNPDDISFANSAGSLAKGKSIRELRNAVSNLKVLSEDNDWNEDWKSQEQAVRDLESLAYKTLIEYRDQLDIPIELKGVSFDVLAKRMQVNPNEYRKNYPNVKNLFMIPRDPDIVNEIVKEDELGGNDPTLEEELRRIEKRKESVNEMVNPRIYGFGGMPRNN